MYVFRPVEDYRMILMMSQAAGRSCGWLGNLPLCSRLLLLHTVACTAVGVAVLVSLLSKVSRTALTPIRSLPALPASQDTGNQQQQPTAHPATVPACTFC